MKITLKEWLAQNGYSSPEEALAEYSELDDFYPLCTDNRTVEPDPHEARSLLSPWA